MNHGLENVKNVFEHIHSLLLIEKQLSWVAKELQDLQACWQASPLRLSLGEHAKKAARFLTPTADDQTSPKIINRPEVASLYQR